MARIPIGQRIRDRRKLRNLSQVALAQQLGISPSYLNLIEHDKRLIGGSLMRNLADALNVDLNWLSGSDDDRLAQDVLEVSRTLALRDPSTASARVDEMNEEGAARFVALNPGWANAFRTLHTRYRAATETAIALSDRLSQDPALVELTHAVLSHITSIRSFAEILEQYGDLDASERGRFSAIIASQSDKLGSSARAMIELLGGEPGAVSAASPATEVDDFIIFHGNHLPILEENAERLRTELSAFSGTLTASIAHRLRTVHQIDIVTGGSNGSELPSALAVAELLDPQDGNDPGSQPAQPTSEPSADSHQNGHAESKDRRTLVHEIGAPQSTRRFAEARLLAEIEFGDLLDELVEDDRLTTNTARSIARRALASYTAGAILFPYEEFLQAAIRYRYDVDHLAALFGGSFEQAAHRLVTLRRPGSEGVPFAFLRADPAGNLSKPFSIPGLRLPRLGTACPLWVLYAALSQPDRTMAQLALMPQGERYLFIARRTSKPGFFGRPGPVFSVMLGCDATYADETVYGGSVAGEGNDRRTEAGFTCRSCQRQDCEQRALPAIYTADKQPGGTGGR